MLTNLSASRVAVTAQRLKKSKENNKLFYVFCCWLVFCFVLAALISQVMSSRLGQKQ